MAFQPLNDSDERTAPPPRLTRVQQRAQTYARLLDSAERVFRQSGYAGTTIDDIAADAGVTKGAVYWHFPNKQALFLALAAASMQKSSDNLGRFLAMRDEPDRFLAEFTRYLDRIDETESLPRFGVELELEARNNPSFRVLHQALVARHEESLAQFLQFYFEMTGKTPCMPLPVMASTLVTLFKGFALTSPNRIGAPVTSAATVRLLLGLPQA